MDIAIIKSKGTAFFKKYKYVALILGIGLLLMMLPSAKPTSEQTTGATVATPQDDLNERLSMILSQIQGAGEVQVLLTVLAGEETIYQSNENTSYSADTGNTKIDTVIVTDADRNQSGLVRQTISPIYLGAVVVCQGADSASVRLAIVEAVSKVTGLGANQISVLKMK